MTGRSTRIKLRFQVQKAIDDFNRGIEHLQKLDEIAGERSDYINQKLPVIVAGFSISVQILQKFREGL